VASKHDYTRNKATADRLIKKFGQAVSLTIAGNAGGYDSSGNVVAPSPPVTVTGDGVKLDYERDEIDGTAIVQGDAKLLLGSASGAPVIGMETTINGDKWRVMAVDTLDPAGVNVMYTLQLRK
jgi:hypothetical protein